MLPSKHNLDIYRHWHRSGLECEGGEREFWEWTVRPDEVAIGGDELRSEHFLNSPLMSYYM